MVRVDSHKKMAEHLFSYHELSRPQRKISVVPTKSMANARTEAGHTVLAIPTLPAAVLQRFRMGYEII